MKTCPTCGALAFDDLETCFRCMGSLDFQSEKKDATATMTAIAGILESLESDPEETMLVLPPTQDYIVHVDPASSSGNRFVLPGKEGASLAIGRAKSNDVVILDPTVSRHHLRLKVEMGKVVAEDLGSRNHSFLDGAKLNGRQPLRTGQCLEVGSSKISLATS